MTAWIESIAGPEFATALTWTIFALIALLVLLVVIRIVRGLTFGTFIAGGRNRKARLAVLDATAVDSQRRLVLVRRDDVEHLILIGGPTDVVVEQGIKTTAPMRRVASEDSRQASQPDAIRPQPAQRPKPEPQPDRQPVAVPVAMPAGTAQARSQAPDEGSDGPAVASPAALRPPVEAVPVAPAPAIQPVRPATPAQTGPDTVGRPDETRTPSFPAVHAPEPRPVAPVATSDPAPATGQFAPVKPVVGTAPAAAAPAAPALASDDLDDALLQELQVTLDREAKPAPAPASERELALDEEMSRLLGSISTRN